MTADLYSRRNTGPPVHGKQESMRNGNRRLWDDWYQDAKAYFEEHGDLLVNRNYVTKESFRLGRWIEIQRARYNGVNPSAMSKTEIAMLEAVGMVWKLENRYSWEQWLEKVRAYHEEHGDIMIPPDYVSDGYALGNWIKEIRQKYHAGLLEEEKIRELDAFGMVWTGCVRRTFEAWYRDAEEYYREHGDLLVPTVYLTRDGYRLGQWISMQRDKYSGKHGGCAMKEERIRLLDKIGMVWDIRTVWEQQWMDTYQSVCSYRREYGKLPLYPKSLTSRNGVQMGRWISVQRDLLSKHKISAEKERLLSEIGIFPWGYNGKSS